MTHMKLAHPENREIASRFTLAMIDGNDAKAEDRAKQLKATWQNGQTQQFTNTMDSAWKIVGTFLDKSPTTKLRHVLDELDRICEPLPKHFPRLEIFGIIKTLFDLSFKFLTGTLPNVSS